MNMTCSFRYSRPSGSARRPARSRSPRSDPRSRRCRSRGSRSPRDATSSRRGPGGAARGRGTRSEPLRPRQLPTMSSASHSRRASMPCWREDPHAREVPLDEVAGSEVIVHWQDRNSTVARSTINRPFDSVAQLHPDPEGDRVNSREVVIVEAVRTPIGRGHRERGYYKDVHPAKLLQTCYEGAARANRARPARGRGPDLGLRHAVRRAELQHRPHRVAPGRPAGRGAGTTIDRQCGSAQQAVNFGAALIAAGVNDVSSARASSTWATTRSRTPSRGRASPGRRSCATSTTCRCRASPPS